MKSISYPDWASPIERYHRRRNAEQAVLEKGDHNYGESESWPVENARILRLAADDDERTSRASSESKNNSVSSQSHGIPDAGETPSLPHRSFSRPKMQLPMVLKGKTIFSTPDSGSEDNIVSWEVASSLGLRIEDAPEHRKEYRMGNNRVVKALGRVLIPCTFAKEAQAELECLFYVFKTLITPVIMGMAFLEATETLTKNRHRLEPRYSLGSGLLRCASLNNPKRHLRCFAMNRFRHRVGYDEAWMRQPILANADTGSEIDLVSHDFCYRRDLEIQEAEEENLLVQFADGSISSILGWVHIGVILGELGNPQMYRRFYVLKDLTCDMLLGEDILNESEAFETFKDAFATEEDGGLAQVNTIVWLKKWERWFGRNKTNLPASQSSALNVITPDHPTGSLIPIAGWRASSQDFETIMDHRDAKENRRREQEQWFIARRVVREQAQARADEEGRIAAFDQETQRLRDQQHRQTAAFSPLARS